MYIPGASIGSQLVFRGNYKLCFSMISAEFGLNSEESMGISAHCIILLIQKSWFKSDDGSNLILLRLILSVPLPNTSYQYPYYHFSVTEYSPVFHYLNNILR